MVLVKKFRKKGLLYLTIREKLVEKKKLKNLYYSEG